MSKKRTKCVNIKSEADESSLMAMIDDAAAAAFAVSYLGKEKKEEKYQLSWGLVRKLGAVDVE